MRIPAIIRRKITRRYELAKYTLLTILAGLVFFLSRMAHHAG